MFQANARIYCHFGPRDISFSTIKWGWCKRSVEAAYLILEAGRRLAVGHALACRRAVTPRQYLLLPAWCAVVDIHRKRWWFRRFILACRPMSVSITQRRCRRPWRRPLCKISQEDAKCNNKVALWAHGRSARLMPLIRLKYRAFTDGSD